MMRPVKHKLVRITTVPISLHLLLKGQMKYMKEQGFEVIMISSPGKEAEWVEREEACEMIVLPMERGVSLFKDLQALVRLTRILKNLEPDIVHTHTPKAGLLGMLAARLAKVPVRMHTIAGLPWMERKGLNRFILKQMERVTAACAHRIYPNSKGLYSFLKEEGISSNGKMKLLGNGSSNGIDCSYFSREAIDEKEIAGLYQQSGLKKHAWVWIFAGRLVRDKGIHELLFAFTHLHELYPDDQLWLLGEEEPHLDPLEPWATEQILAHSNIFHWGFQKDVRPFFAAAQVLVFPSYREGMPNVPLQAGAMGCAMILSNINGCNEIVTDGDNGFLVPPKNKEALFQKMLTLRNQPAMQQSFAQKTRTAIAQQYDRTQVWQHLHHEYKNLLKQSHE